MKLHDSAMAPNPRRVRIFLAEKGIEVPTVQVDLGKSENREPPFLALNPLGGVPILELDDGSVISESVAICRYFEETQPEPALLGSDAQDRANVEMWQRRAELVLFNNVTGCFRNTHDFFKGRIPQVAEYGAVCKEGAISSLGFFDDRLSNSEFLSGDAYTIADITALVALDFGRISEIRIGPEHKHLTRWYETVSNRPSANA